MHRRDAEDAENKELRVASYGLRVFLLATRNSPLRSLRLCGKKNHHRDAEDAENDYLQ